MKRRLTVHLENAPSKWVEVKTKEGPKKMQKTFNTLTFDEVEEEDVAKILQDIKDNKQGTPVDHYWTNHRIPGRSKGKQATSHSK